MGSIVHIFLVISLTVGAYSSRFQNYARNGNRENFDASESMQEVQRLKDEIQQLHEQNQALLTASSEANRKLDVAEKQLRNNSATTLRPVDCTDILLSGVQTSGIYEIYPFVCSCSSPIYVYCDMETDGGGWTVLLNRQPELESRSNHINFNRSWDEYKYGFGSVSHEYYLGNENIHRLTNGREYHARFDMLTTNGEMKTASYDNFRVQNEDMRYRLTLGNRQPESSTRYDCYYYMKSRYFSTYDRDHDSSSSKNCASNAGGGFWYYDCRISYPPTGPYDGYMNNTCYYTSERYELNSLQLKIRPANCDDTYKKILVARSCDGRSNGGCGGVSGR